ncbi:hypothetical protein [Actinocrispum wychmicini]|uniref:Uncharacterized protein n=1 Tax=Actinocrispum wychmicini TaxID=1213861 RepID=A0A4V2S3X4_9PSEU|nr:hypothetical protein [Actinocrispum wychmicini]TCO45890.1 hypothetical protein EV192_12076 [Actinocrispum wychmicini]
MSRRRTVVRRSALASVVGAVPIAILLGLTGTNTASAATITCPPVSLLGIQASCSLTVTGGSGLLPARYTSTV